MALKSLERTGEDNTLPIFFVNKKGDKFLSSQILSYHETLADIDNIKSPYFNFTKSEGTLYLEEIIVGGMRRRIGNIKAFTKEEMACFLENAIENYKEKGTMGDFPRGNSIDTSQLHAERELTKVFVEGFNHEKEWAVIMIDKRLPGGETTIVGGCLVSAGLSSKSLNDLVGKPEASISTLSCLSFDFGNNKELGNTEEENVVSVNRLFTLSRGQAKNIGLSKDEKSSLLANLISGIDIAVKGLVVDGGKLIKFGLADVSDPLLLGFVNNYDWNLITDDTKPTDFVKETILRHHYVYYTDVDSETGKKRKIYAIYKKY